MKFQKYLIGIWTAVVVYTLFSFLGGPRSLPAYNYLLSEREIQRENIRNLGVLNEELERTRNNLLYDQDTIMVHARHLGYGHENERFIRIVGLGNTKPVPSTTGSVYTAQFPDFILNKNIKIVALCIGLLVFSFFFMMEFIESRLK